LIRVATTSDLIALTNLAIQHAREIEVETDVEIVKAGIKYVIENSLNGNYYVYEIDNDIIGFAYVTTFFNPYKKKIFWEIQGLYLKESYKAKKTIDNFLNYLYHLAKDLNLGGIILYNQNDYLNSDAIDTAYWYKDLKTKIYKSVTFLMDK